MTVYYACKYTIHVHVHTCRCIHTCRIVRTCTCIYTQILHVHVYTHNNLYTCTVHVCNSQLRLVEWASELVAVAEGLDAEVVGVLLLWEGDSPQLVEGEH